MKIPFLSILDENGDVSFHKLLLALILIIVVLFVGVVVYRQLTFTEDVINQSLEVNDPDRVQELRTQVLNRYHGLEGQLSNLNSVRERRNNLVAGLGDRSTWPLDIADEHRQLGEQILQLESAYSNGCSQFKAFVEDPSRNIALPSDLPRECPS